MGAVYYTLSGGKDVFKGGFPIVSPVSIDFMDELVNPQMMAILSSVQVQNNETVQFFLSFDDLITYFYFGKGLGSITLSGIMFSDCDGYVPGLAVSDDNASTGLPAGFYKIISDRRGKKVVVSLGSASFTGVITSFSTNTIAEPDIMSEFQIVLTVIDHNLPLDDSAFEAQCVPKPEEPENVVPED